MTRRKYIYESPKPGRKDRAVLEYAGELDGRERAILALPRDTPPEITMEILEAIRRAYEAGREDRASELIPASDHGDQLRRIVHAEALGAVDQWGPGYTDAEVHDDGDQYYLALESRDEANGVLVMGIRDERHGGDLERYRVSVLVERIEQR